MAEGVVSSRVITEHKRTELVEKRDDHTRIWEIVREVETTHPDGSTTVDTVNSYIHEKASGLCYKGGSGAYVPSVAEWRETPDGFVVDRCAYCLAMGKTIGVSARYTVEGNDLLLRPAHLIISDGVNEADLATLNPETSGLISPDNPSVLRFPSAFGEGYDLEYVAEKGGFHQNLIIANPPELPDGFNPATASIHLYTELNLDEYLSASGCEVSVEGELVNASAADLVTEPSRNGCISFSKDGRLLHAFCVSQVSDSSGLGALDKQTVAEKRLMKESASGKAYLVESVPFSYFTEKALTYPVTWDYVQKNSPITSDETWEPRYTYWVSSNVAVSAILTVLPGTTVKLSPSTSINIVPGGRIAAEGEPYNYITFARARDENCGESISGPADEPYSTAVYLQVGSSSQSAIRYCKIGGGLAGINCQKSLNDPEDPDWRPIAHNVVHGRYGGERVMVFGIIVSSGANTDCHNNLVTGCNWWAIYYYGSSAQEITNNTVDDSNAGILLQDVTCEQVTDNLVTNCDVTGIGGNHPDIHVRKNAFFNVPSGYGSDYTLLGYSPYDQSPVGNYFLNDYGAGILEDGGSRNATAAGLDGEVFAIRAPFNVSGTGSGQLTWDKICYDGEDPYSMDTGPVSIGYHHNRIDRYLNTHYTISGSGTVLTISPGVVAVFGGDEQHYYGALQVLSSARLICNGDPQNGGYNLFTRRKPASMIIESPHYTDYWLGEVKIYSSASNGCQVTFSIFERGGSLTVMKSVTSPIRSNIFRLTYRGLYLRETNSAFNNLHYWNYRGFYQYYGYITVSYSTFDENDEGAYVYMSGSGYYSTIRDSLFTSNGYGIRAYAYSGAQVTEHHNAFYANNTNYQKNGQAQSANEEDILLAESPYEGGLRAYQGQWFLDGYEPAVNGGSQWSSEAGLSSYSIGSTGLRDVGRADVGYHRAQSEFADGDGDGMPDVWEVSFGLDPEWSGDASQDTDGDGLTSLAEYQGGSDPTLSDTDEDGFSDYEEIVVRSLDPRCFDTDRDLLGDKHEVVKYLSDPRNKHTFNINATDAEYKLTAAPGSAEEHDTEAYLTIDFVELPGPGSGNWFPRITVHNWQQRSQVIDFFFADDLLQGWRPAEKAVPDGGATTQWIDREGPGRLLWSHVPWRFYMAGSGDDSDGDGLPDGCEVGSAATGFLGTSPDTKTTYKNWGPDRNVDRELVKVGDNYELAPDGLSAFLEYTYFASPRARNTDGDTWLDGEEVGLEDNRDYLKTGFGPADDDFQIDPYMIDLTPNGVTVKWRTESNTQGYDFWLREYNGDEYTITAQSEPAAATKHQLVVDGLTPDRTYCLRIAYPSGTANTLTAAGIFQTKPQAGTAVTFRFIVYGDNRTNEPDHCGVIASMLRHNDMDNPSKFALHVGDFVNSGSSYSGWRTEFFDQAARALVRLPIFPTIGNHEKNDAKHDWEEGNGDGTWYDDFFFPTHWYSFDYGKCHFICLDTNVDYDDDSDQGDEDREQWDWLLADLRSEAAAEADWVIVSLHCPPYTDSVETTHDWEAWDVHDVRQKLAPVFENPNHPDPQNPHRTADLVFSGHNHFYERSLWNGVDYIVTGGGGAPFHNPFRNPNRNTGRQKAAQEFHHCVLEPLSATDMRLIVWGGDALNPIEDVTLH